MAVRVYVWKPPTPEIRARVAALTAEGFRDLEQRMLKEITRHGRPPRTTRRRRRKGSRDRSGYWPVDTGRSSDKMYTQLRGGRVIEFWNRQRYAIWVYRRWFKDGFRRFFTASKMRAILDSIEVALEQRPPPEWSPRALNEAARRGRTRQTLRSSPAALAGAASAIAAAGGIEAAGLFAFESSAGFIAGQLSLFMAEFDRFGKDFDDLTGRSDPMGGY